MALHAVLDFIREYSRQNRDASKTQVAEATAKTFSLRKRGSVYASDTYALRFSIASTKSFSNTVLALSVLRRFDSLPFVVCVLRPGSTEFLLANTTFLRKISHSSHRLRIGNIKGSFLGHDIFREYAGLANSPENFDRLFAIHKEFMPEENLERLVEATGNIAGTGSRFEPTTAQRQAILQAPGLAAKVARSPGYQRVKTELAQIVAERTPVILEAAQIDNVNLRGNRIEQIITGGINDHDLADVIHHLDAGIELHLEIKTKLLDRASSPKAYNIDKALTTLARGSTVISFFFVGLNKNSSHVAATTVSIFDRTVLGATRIQFHWAGRNSRGETQLTGNLSSLFSGSHREEIDVDEAKRFLEKLLE